MKTVTLNIDDDIFKEFDDASFKSAFAVSALGGVLKLSDELLHFVVKAINEGQETILLRKRVVAPKPGKGRKPRKSAKPLARKKTKNTT